MCDGGVPQDEAVSQASLLASFSAGLLKASVPNAEAALVAPSTPDLPEDLARGESPPTAYVMPSDTAIAMGAFVISIQVKSGFKRLHRMGDCALRPGVDYACFENLGSEEPAARFYTAKCKHCFRGRDEAPQGVLSGSSASSSNTDSS